MATASPPTLLERSLEESRLWNLVHEIEQLAPGLPRATLVAASRRLAVLAASEGSGEGDEGLPAQQLDGLLALAAPATEDADGARSDAGDSVGSIDATALLADGDGESRAPSPVHDGAGFDDTQLWPGGPLASDAEAYAHAWRSYLPAPAEAADAADAEEAEEAGEHVADSVRDTRLGQWHGRDSIGLSAHGRVMYCDYCDLHGGVAIACMAQAMLQEGRIARIITKHQKRRQRHGRRRSSHAGDGREARHACYKGIVAWQWANPLGAEQRVRLPLCVTRRVRQLFPNPKCCEADGCDYGASCERQGHYTGFRTAARSREIREGAYLDDM